VLAHRGVDLQRRLVVVLPRDANLPWRYVDALLARVPVYRDQPLRQAVADAAALGTSLPGARVIDPEVDARSWTALCEHADPEAVAFASRRHELAWQRRVLGYADVADA
jgi:hypothetical protein